MFQSFYLIFVLLFSSFANGDDQCGLSNEKPSNSTQCTPVSESRVIGGQCANPGQFPWVTLVDLIFYNRRAGFCGGAILDKYTILTAAHCTFACIPFPGIPPLAIQKYNVTVGERSLKDPNDGQKTYLSKTAIVHEDYEPCSEEYSNDIALLKIDEPGLDIAHFTENGLGSTNSICLPQTSKDYTDYEVITAGWGRTNKDTYAVANILQYATISVIPDENCTETYGEAYDPETMICGYAPGKSSCNGDSGTALFHLQPGQGNSASIAETIGIVSFGMENCVGHPVVYTKVARYLQFIKEHLGPKPATMMH